LKKDEPYRKVKIRASLFDKLVADKIIKSEDFVISDYGIEGESYPKDVEWVELKAKSNKAYKEVKKENTF
jgi:hypothetical protein